MPYDLKEAVTELRDACDLEIEVRSRRRSPRKATIASGTTKKVASKGNSLELAFLHRMKSRLDNIAMELVKRHGREHAIDTLRAWAVTRKDRAGLLA